jgi:RNA polymerase sigma-70 factor (ECF subfamily)
MKTLSPDPGRPQITDEDLIRAVARGDERAFASLFDSYSSRLFGFLLRMLKIEAEAEEVLQEVFMQVWQRAADFDEARGRAFTWIVTIARSRALDRLRTRRSNDRKDTVAFCEMQEYGPGGLEDVIRSEEREMVRRALGELSEVQRQTILLAYYEGLTHPEIAERLGTPLGTVKTRTRDGLGKLRKILGQAPTENPHGPSAADARAAVVERPRGINYALGVEYADHARP